MMMMLFLQEFHPRNICNVCNFTAEYVYVIKRHMHRHSNKGCECEVCGKLYRVSAVLYI